MQSDNPPLLTTQPWSSTMPSVDDSLAYLDEVSRAEADARDFTDKLRQTYEELWTRGPAAVNEYHTQLEEEALAKCSQADREHLTSTLQQLLRGSSSTNGSGFEDMMSEFMRQGRRSSVDAPAAPAAAAGLSMFQPFIAPFESLSNALFGPASSQPMTAPTNVTPLLSSLHRPAAATRPASREAAGTSSGLLSPTSAFTPPMSLFPAATRNSIALAADRPRAPSFEPSLYDFEDEDGSSFADTTSRTRFATDTRPPVSADFRSLLASATQTAAQRSSSSSQRTGATARYMPVRRTSATGTLGPPGRDDDASAAPLAAFLADMGGLGAPHTAYVPQPGGGYHVDMHQPGASAASRAARDASRR